MSTSADFTRYVGWLKHRVGSSRNKIEGSESHWRYAFLLEDCEASTRRLIVRAFNGSVFQAEFSEAEFEKQKSEKSYLSTWKNYFATLVAALHTGAVSVEQEGETAAILKLEYDSDTALIQHSFLLERSDHQDDAKNSFLEHLMIHMENMYGKIQQGVVDELEDEQTAALSEMSKTAGDGKAEKDSKALNASKRPGLSKIKDYTRPHKRPKMKAI